MDIVMGQEEMAKQAKEATYQEPFPMEVKCPKCKRGMARLMLLIDDDERTIAAQRPPKVQVWPHDRTAIALYLCTECGEMIADWNQA